MEYTIRFLFNLIILFLLCGCKTRTDSFNEHTTSDSTITSDPFKTFTPDVYSSIDQNGYASLMFRGILTNVNIEKIYYESINDTLQYVSSGLNGANFLLEIPRRIQLPDKGNRLELEIIYEYAPFPNETDLLLEVIFLNKNTIIEEYIEKLPPTTKIGDPDKRKDISIAKYNYQIPKNANNVQTTIYTYNKRIYDYLTQNPSDSITLETSGAAYLALKKFGFKVNGKPLEEYIYDHKIPFTKQEIDEVQSKVNDNLKIDTNVRIFGIGESIHGNRAFNIHRNEIVKQLIDEGFTVIGFEYPISLGIQLNDYITGSDSNIDTILTSHNWAFNYTDNPETKEFFNYLREYNQKNNNRISVFGFDIEKIDFETYSENEYLGIFFEKYGSYYKNEMSYTLLRRHRDEIMSENISYIDSCFSGQEKIVLSAHLGHLYKRKSPAPAAGYFLSEKYGSQYAVVG